MVSLLSLGSNLSPSQDLPFGGTKASGYGRFGEFFRRLAFSWPFSCGVIQVALRVCVRSPIPRPSSQTAGRR